MPHPLETLLGHSVAGGFRGGLEGLMAEGQFKDREIAKTWSEGAGTVPVDMLAQFIRAGWRPYPDVDTQLSPHGEFDPMETRKRGYAYVESPQVRAKRERTEGYQKKLGEIPEHDFYNYLRKTLKYSEGESEDLTKTIFDLDELPWIQKEPEKPTEVRRQWTAKQVNLVRKMFESGEVNQENYKKDLSAFAQQIAEDEGFVKAPEKPPKGKELGATEQRIITILQKKPSGTAKHNVLWMNRKGFEIDEGKDEWKPRTVDAMDFFQMMMGGGTSKETPEGKSKVPTKPEYYGATSIAELEGALDSDPEITESMKAKILENARNAGLR